MARGRPAGSKSTTAVTLADLVNYMREDATVMVGTSWLRDFERFNNVKFHTGEAPPIKVTVMDKPEILEGGEEKDADREVRESISLVAEEL